LNRNRQNHTPEDHPMLSSSSLVRVIATLAILLLAPPTAFACSDLLDQFNRALERRDLAEMLKLEHRIASDAACGNRLVEVQVRRSALQLLLADQLIKQGAPASQYEALVVEAEQPQAFWRASETLGDLRYGQRRFADATRAYERALEIIKNPSKTPEAPDQSVSSRIFTRAAHSRLLAAEQDGKSAEFVSPPKDARDGSRGGIFSSTIRGFRPTVVPLPINFYTASTRFTDIGEAAAREFAAVLSEQRPAAITVVGHADRRGEYQYNMRLSADRAKAVESYLRNNGIKARIEIIAKGWTDPVAIPDPTGLTQQDIWALNRRVEWKRD
jgi:outer membrane protein OmpA-like peptidoglycan-associated protein